MSRNRTYNYRCPRQPGRDCFSCPLPDCAAVNIKATREETAMLKSVWAYQAKQKPRRVERVGE